MATPTAQTQLHARAAVVREFNRFYTRHLGVLQRGFLGTRFSLTEARILYELANAEGETATRLAGRLGLDAGYLSRLLSRFERERLLERPRSKADRRRRPLRLTARGRRAAAVLDARSQGQAMETLRALPPGRQAELMRAMRTVQALVGTRPADRVFVLREPRPGDFGWIVQRHGALYAEEHGWDQTFEALVAEIVVGLLRPHDRAGERGWIAERDGENAGCIFLVRRSRHVAQLRLLLVEPSARGHGLGRRLVDECVRFARAQRYRKVVLWTNGALKAAAHLYREAGFEVVDEERQRHFGHDQVEQTWELDLGRGPGAPPDRGR
ncbi:MAG TPA: helix-turn-helix domain-containing GNAT family N-acetyltransferase [Vicinamibacteria bacterium]|nr:helix-turn-helix domain-containing GNAT family N-acetyltransferase [Vicinamibacteria bacterium]